MSLGLRENPLIAVLLVTIVVSYFVIGTLYAVLTPIWQVPDEPAHYNYVRWVAEGNGLPVLEPGDYDQEYLERLTSEGFPADLPIEPLRYEDHQPPLFYLLAAPIYSLVDGAVLPLRMLSVVLGAGLLIAAFGTTRTVFPRQPHLALMVTAFIAFVPQHVAMTAGVNNDALAGLTVGGALWALAGYVRRTSERPGSGAAQEPRPWHLGILLGAALLTKATAYVVVGVALAAVVLRAHRDRRPWSWMVRQTAWMLAPALLLSGPWFIRNALTYGWLDPMGLARHHAVVAGQPRSYQWLAAYGWAGLIDRMVRTTFQSFWAQFGWMAVPLPARFYAALAIFSVLLLAGFLVWFLRRPRCYVPGPLIHHPVSLLALSASLTFLAFCWYNLTFVQHQGRYLHPALIPLGTVVALGLDVWVRLLPARYRAWALTVFFAGMSGFVLYCLFVIVVPNL